MALVPTGKRLLYLAVVIAALALIVAAQVSLVGGLVPIDASAVAPGSALMDGAGNLYVADADGLWELSANGTSTTDARLKSAFNISGGDLAVDGKGDVFVSGVGPGVVEERSAAGVYSEVNTGGYNLYQPAGLALDSGGDLYIADSGNHRVLEVAANGAVRVVSTGSITLVRPAGLALDGSGDLYIADYGANQIVEVTSAGAAGVVASVTAPVGLAFDATGSLCVSDGNGLQMVAAAGGNAVSLPITIAWAGDDFEFLHAGPSGSIYIADAIGKVLILQAGSIAAGAMNQPAMQTDPLIAFFNVTAGTSVGTVGVVTQGVANQSFTDAGGGTCTAQTYTAATLCSVNLNFNQTLASYAPGAVLIDDGSGNNLATAFVSGSAGLSLLVATPSAPAAVATTPLTLAAASGLAIDPAGNLYLTDAGANAVAYVPASGAAETLNLGSPNGVALSAPRAVALDGAGNLYIADTGNGRLLRYSGGSTAAVALGGTCPAPAGLAADGAGDVYVACGSGGLLKLSPAGSTAAVATPGLSTVANVSIDAVGDIYAGDGGTQILKIPPTGSPTLVPTNGMVAAVLATVEDPAGDVYVLDQPSHAIVELGATGAVTQLVSLPAADVSGGSSLGMDLAGNLYLTTGGPTVERLTRSSGSLSFANTAVGTTSADSPKTVTVSNIGSFPMVFQSVAYPTDFPENTGDGSDCASATVLQPSTGCDVSVNFTPTVAGPLSETVALGYTQAGVARQLTVAVAGNNAAASTTTLSPSETTAGEGYAVTLTATVMAASGSGAPTGTVSFYDGTTLLGTAALSSGTATYTATFNGAGAQTLTAAYGGDEDFAASTSAPVTISVVQPAFAISASAQTMTVAANGSGQVTVAITPSGNYQGTVALSCSGLPAAASCAFVPATVSLSGNNAPQQVTVTISSATAGLSAPLRTSPPWLPAALLLLALPCLIWRRRRMPLLAGVAALLLLAGCGGGNSPAPAGGSTTSTPYTQTVTITATGTGSAGTGSPNQTQTAALTVTFP